MPSVRQLAGDLGLANGTVARAYAALETDGVLATDRTGTRVRAVDPLPADASGAAAASVEAVRGLPLEEALRAVRVEWLRATT